MIRYFPTPYKDEVLYSILARYHLHSGNKGITPTLVDLFSTRKITAIIDFPCSLSQLTRNLKSSFPNCQPEDFINNHTLYPFFKPFWSIEKADCITELMKDKSSGDIHLKAGTYASGIKQWKYLRYCSACIKEDMQNLGEAYWHRVHQLPGVLICPIHNTPTYNSKVRTYEVNQQFYYTINERNCNTNVNESPIHNSRMCSDLNQLSEDIKWVLDNGTSIKAGINHKVVYSDILKNKGLMSKKGQVDQVTLVNEFEEYYGKNFLEQLGLPIDHDNSHNWVSMMVRKDSQEPHPLKHLLMIRFLYGSVKKYFTNYTKSEPFFKGPYPCLNTTADHYKSCVISEPDIRYSRNKKPYAIFSCTCGFSYIRYGPDKQCEDKYRYDSVLSYGEVWTKHFCKLVEEDQLHLREVSRLLKFNLKTVRKLVLKFGLQSKWMSETTNNREFNNEHKPQTSNNTVNITLINSYRDKWRTLKMDNPNLSKTQLRNIDMKTYNWLYYHDKTWLTENSPRAIKVRCPISRVDWEQRDWELKTKAEEVINKLYKLDKPVRITIERVGKELGKLYLLRNHLDKLPITKEYLDIVCEGRYDFLFRKAKLIVDYLCLNGEKPKYWRVKQLMCVSRELPTEIEEEINIYIEKCGGVSSINMKW